MNKDYVNSWIDIAIKDLDASTILYNNRLFSNSFYHFQQASEKGLKAYAFWSKIFTTEKDANNTGHYTLEFFKKSINKRLNELSILNQSNFETLIGAEQLNDYSSNLNKGLNVMPKKKEVFEYSGVILNKILETLESLKVYKFSFPNKFDSLFKEKVNSLFDLLYELNPKEIESAKAEVNKIFQDEEEYVIFKHHLEKVFRNIFNENYHVSILYFSNLISHNHNNMPRYPEIDFNPLKYYNLRRPIIKKLPEFSNYLHSSLIQLKKWNEISPTSK